MRSVMRSGPLRDHNRTSCEVGGCDTPTAALYQISIRDRHRRVCRKCAQEMISMLGWSISVGWVSFNPCGEASLHARGS
jgi:hypothetical protein